MATKSEEKVDERLRDLENRTVALDARIDFARKEVDGVASAIEASRTLETRVALLEQRVSTIEESGRRHWSFWSSVVGGVVVGLFVIIGQVLAQLILTHFK